MIEIKLFEQEDGSVMFEAKRYTDNGEAASFTVITDANQRHLNRTTTAREYQATLDTIRQVQRFAGVVLK